MWRHTAQARAPREKGAFGGVMLGALVVLVHIGLIGLMTAFVMVLGSLFEYRLFLFLGTVGLASFVGYAVYRRFDFHARQVLAILRDPAIRGRSLEVSLLGGMASVRVGRAEDEASILTLPGSGRMPFAEAPEASRVRDLASLAGLREQGHVTEEEFERLKRGLLAGPSAASPPPQPGLRPPTVRAHAPAALPPPARSIPAARTPAPPSPHPVGSALKTAARWAWRKVRS